jgi:hypothetical protein
MPGAPVDCVNCGTRFYVKPHRATRARFCSRACTFAHRFGRAHAPHGVDVSGAKNPNYRGTNNLTTARQVAFRVYPRRCMICGFEDAVDVHHVVGRRHQGSNDPSNLAVLCPNHHRLADQGRISQAVLLSTIRAATAQR